MTHKQQVLREYPGAWFNSSCRTIEGYSEGLVYGEGLVLGIGSVLAKSIEASAWKDAAKQLKISAAKKRRKA